MTPEPEMVILFDFLDKKKINLTIGINRKGTSRVFNLISPDETFAAKTLTSI